MTSYCELKDFDWSARIVLASDKISGLRDPLVSLKLFLTLPEGHIEEKDIELSVSDVNTLLSNLKAAKIKIRDNFGEQS